MPSCLLAPSLLGGVPPSNVMCPAFLFLTSEVC